jgi:hypothetical protein
VTYLSWDQVYPDSGQRGGNTVIAGTRLAFGRRPAEAVLTQPNAARSPTSPPACPGENRPTCKPQPKPWHNESAHLSCHTRPIMCLCPGETLKSTAQRKTLQH